MPSDGSRALSLPIQGSTFVWAEHMRWARQQRCNDPYRPQGVERHAEVEHRERVAGNGSVCAALLPPVAWGKCTYCEEMRRLSAPRVNERQKGWQSPLVHTEGSSWHATDSVLILTLFCYLVCANLKNPASYTPARVHLLALLMLASARDRTGWWPPPL